jgi:hypothetical protein
MFGGLCRFGWDCLTDYCNSRAWTHIPTVHSHSWKKMRTKHWYISGPTCAQYIPMFGPSCPLYILIFGSKCPQDIRIFETTCPLYILIFGPTCQQCFHIISLACFQSTTSLFRINYLMSHFSRRTNEPFAVTCVPDTDVSIHRDKPNRNSFRKIIDPIRTAIMS